MSILGLSLIGCVGAPSPSASPVPGGEPTVAPSQSVGPAPTETIAPPVGDAFGIRPFAPPAGFSAQEQRQLALLVHGCRGGLSKIEPVLHEAGEHGAEVGLQMASELLAAVDDRVAGTYVMPSFGRYEQAAELVRRLRARHAAARVSA